MGLKPRQPTAYTVHLVGFNTRGEVVAARVVSAEDYYDGDIAEIDSDDHRASHGIVGLVGRIYGSAGRLQQAFENLYTASGELTGTRAFHADGTTNEDGFDPALPSREQTALMDEALERTTRRTKR